MSTTRQPEPRTARTLRIRGRRLAAGTLLVVLTPMSLAACGLFGGQTNHGAAPVEISTEGPDQAGVTGAAVDSGADGGAVTATQRTTELLVSGGATVTKTGVIVRTRVQVQVQVNTKTAVRTQQVVKTSVNVQTQTQTQTVTATQFATVKETVQVPGPTKLVTVKCTAPC